MILLYYGDQSLMIKKYAKKAIEERLKQPDELSLITFDMNETSFFTVIDEASLLPLGYDKKVVVLNNCFFLNTKFDIPKELKSDFEKGLEEFIKFLKNPNPDCDLILTCETSSINLNSDIFKIIKTTGKVGACLSVSEDDWIKYIKRYFEERLGVSIDNDAVSELAARINNDLNVLVNEGEKLSLYTNHITYKDVVTLVNKPVDANIFDIYNHLLKHENDKAIKIYRDLISKNTEVITIISTISNQFRLLYQIKYLVSIGANEETIMSETNIKNPKRIAILKRSAYALSFERLHEIIDKLYELDSNIKSGLITDRFYAFEMFLATFIC